MLSEELSGWDAMPTLSQEEFEAILADESKRIVGDLIWVAEPGKPGGFKFRAPVRHAGELDMFVAGFERLSTKRLSFALVYDERRIAGLDLGAVFHTNKDRTRIVGTHLHLWVEQNQETQAYAAPEVTARFDQTMPAWQQFCARLRIVHLGRFREPQREESIE